MKYRKKPIEVDAVQWTGLNLEEVQAFVTDEDGTALNLGHSLSAHTLLIPTLEGDLTAQAGDWIIRGIAGEIYPCKPDIFDATYEAVAEPDRLGDAATAGEPVADIALAPAEQAAQAPVTCPHAWAEGSETITCELEPGHEGAHVGPGGSAPPA